MLGTFSYLLSGIWSHGSSSDGSVAVSPLPGRDAGAGPTGKSGQPSQRANPLMLPDAKIWHFIINLMTAPTLNDSANAKTTALSMQKGFIFRSRANTQDGSRLHRSTV